MTFAQSFALISLLTLGALFLVGLVCALGRCDHQLHWQIDADKIIQRCNCGERSQP